jgi:hypothetical protein
MSWFQRHLHWTWICGNSLTLILAIYYPEDYGFPICILVFLLSSGWVIKEKGRSMWWILLSPLLSPIWLINNRPANDAQPTITRPDEQQQEEAPTLLSGIKEGKIESVKFIWTKSPVMLQSSEEPLVVLPDIELWEPRSVRRTAGRHGGPSIRIFPGFTWRMGAFAAESEAHEELRKIDTGALTVTDKRVLFTGAMRSTETRISKIIAVEAYADGIAMKASGRSKVQYLLGLQPKNFVALNTAEGRKYDETFNGLWLASIIEGVVKRQRAVP